METHPVLAANPGTKLFHLTGNVFAEVAEWQGTRYLDIREWWTVEGRWTRTKKAVRVELKDFADFAEKLPALVEWARGRM